MFKECLSLKNIFGESKKLQDRIKFFEGGKSLESVTEKKIWNTSNITNMSNLFCGCKLLKSLPDISKWNINKVTFINSMFKGCESLESLPDIKIWDTM